MILTYTQKAEAKFTVTIVRVLWSGRARYGLSAGAITTACCAAMATVASDAGISDDRLGSWLHTMAVWIENGEKDFHGLARGVGFGRRWPQRSSTEQIAYWGASAFAFGFVTDCGLA